MTSKLRMTACLANDELGYIIPENQWDVQKYEETMSVSKSTTREVEETLLELMRRAESQSDSQLMNAPDLVS